MKKFTFIILSLFIITLVALFYIKLDKGAKIDSKENFIMAPQNINELEDYLKIIFLDVGQGDSAFIEWPSGKQMIVDCGRDSKVLSQLGTVMPFYDKYIDYLLVTHPDLDHFGGCIDILQRFDVGELIYNGLQKNDKSWEYFWDLVGQKKIKKKKIDKYDIWNIENTKLTFLYPNKDISIDNISDNDASIVFILSFGQSDIMFTGDAEEGLEKYLVENYSEALDSEVLKVSHHGSGGSSINDFLNKVTPEYSVISAGENNSYGHPSLRILRRIERVGSKIFRTDLLGNIAFNVYENYIEPVFE